MYITSVIAAIIALPSVFAATVVLTPGFEAAVQTASQEASKLLREIGNAIRNEPAESADCTVREEGRFRRYTLVVRFQAGRPSVFRKMELLDQARRDLSAAIGRLSDADKTAIRQEIARFLEIEAALRQRRVFDPADKELARQLRAQYEHVTRVLSRARLDNAQWKLFETEPTVANIHASGWFVLQELARAASLPQAETARLRRRANAGSDGEWRAIFDRVCRAQTGFPR